MPLLLVAPSGHVFTSLTFYPIADGNGAAMEVALYVLGTSATAGSPQFAPPRSEMLAAARERGIVWDGVPSSGILHARCVVRVEDTSSEPVTVHGVRVVPRFAARPDAGAIEVSCEDTTNFRVEVDGIFARWFPGIAGPLAPGEHIVRLTPVEPGSPYGEWETRVTVQPAKVTRLLGRLPWKSGSPWSSWKSVYVGRDYPGYDLRLYAPVGAPAIQADEGAIRLVWSYRGDLWSSVSTEGETFSPPAKLDLPLSSGWLEKGPRLLRDESGRFILTFLSDREARHRNLAYLCWSRDFVHWSAPALVSEETVADYDLIQDDRSRFIWAQMLDHSVRILFSRDGFHWQRLGDVDVGQLGWYCRLRDLIQHEDGRFELFVDEFASGSIPEIRKRKIGGRVLCYVSSDCRTWSPAEVIAECHYDATPESLACAHAQGQTFLLWCRREPPRLHSRMALYARKPDRRWHEDGCVRSMPPGEISLAFHPRWGYLIASMMPEGWGTFPYPCRGPYLMRGPNLDPFYSGAPDTRLAWEDPSPRPEKKIRRGHTRDADGRVINVSLSNPAVLEWGQAFRPPVVSDKQVGRLTSLPFLRSMSQRSAWVGSLPERIPTGSMYLEVKEGAAFKRPAPQSMALSSRAVVLNFTRDTLNLAVALDSRTPESPHYDVLRFDAKGRGDFENALEIPWVYMSFDPPPDEAREYAFGHPSVSLKVGHRTVQAGVAAEFRERRGQRTFKMNLYTCSSGQCLFDKKAHNLLLFDADGSLRVDDAYRVAVPVGHNYSAGEGDVLVVDPVEGPYRRLAWGYYGHPLLVDGALYDVSVSKDGEGVGATPYEGKTGFVRIDHPYWEAEFANNASALVLYGGPAPVPVPPGRYRVLRYMEWSPSDAEQRDPLKLWRPKSAAGEELWVEIEAGQTTEILIGSPITGRLAVMQKDRTLHFRLDPMDVSGRPGLTVRWGGWMPRGTVHVRDASGQTIKILRGGLTGKGIQWPVPPGLKGAFSASVEVEAGPFPTAVERAEFAVN